MQAVASEMNLSETAFLLKEADGYRLRWFTPKVEVDLCGHATLASAHVLWTEGYVGSAATINFYTKSGVLRAARKEALIELDFPTTPPVEAVSAVGFAGRFGDFRPLRRPQPVRLPCRGRIRGNRAAARP